MLKIEVEKYDVKFTAKGSKFEVWRDATLAISAIITEISSQSKDPKVEKENFCNYLKETVPFGIKDKTERDYDAEMRKAIDSLGDSPEEIFLKALGEVILLTDKKNKGKSEESENGK